MRGKDVNNSKEEIKSDPIEKCYELFIGLLSEEKGFQWATRMLIQILRSLAVSREQEITFLQTFASLTTMKREHLLKIPGDNLKSLPLGKKALAHSILKKELIEPSRK